MARMPNFIDVDDFSKHEAVDRAHLMGTIFDTSLLEHPAIKSDPALHLLATKISDDLGALYQAAGAKYL